MPHQYYAILIDGAFSSGKTTFIETISHQTGSLQLPDITLCYGQINLDEETHVLLYEISSNRGSRQHLHFQHHNQIGRILGILLLINTLRSETFRETRALFETYFTYSPLPLLLVAQPHTPSLLSITWDLEALRHLLRIPEEIPMMECNAKDRDSVKETLIALLEHAGKIEFIEATEPPVQETLPTVSEFLSTPSTHYSILVIGTFDRSEELLFVLHHEVISLWLVNDADHTPSLWHYVDLDEQTRLHFIIQRGYGVPPNDPLFWLKFLESSGGREPRLSLVIEEVLEIPSHAVGGLVLFQSGDPDSEQRAQQFRRLQPHLPCVLVDCADKPHPPTEIDVTVPIVPLPKFDQHFKPTALHALIKQLPTEVAQKFLMHYPVK
jgi:hypothetical protein